METRHSNKNVTGINTKGGAHREVGASILNSFRKDGYQIMFVGLIIDRLQKRHDRLYEKAHEIKEWLDENATLTDILDHKIVRKYRQMDALFMEASVISTCLTTFRESCYEPMGPLV